MDVVLEDIQNIIHRYRLEPDGRISYILETIQKTYRYIPESAMRIVSRELNIPLTQLYGVATFYSAFSLEEKGEHIISVCHGTVCHVKGSKRVAEALRKELGIKEGETTKDKFATLEAVRCLGCCSLAPVISVDGEIHVGMTSTKVPDVLAHLRGGETHDHAYGKD
ncbi:MAG: NAD(P)H-dependent oxidoreductase subunit E [Bacillota bacterium]|jgi:NADH-quinone oxidoreductase subunit E